MNELLNHPECKTLLLELRTGVHRCIFFGATALAAFGVPAHSQLSKLNPPHDVEASALAQRSLDSMGARTIATGAGVELRGKLTLQGQEPVSYPILIKGRAASELHVELQTPVGVRTTVMKNGRGEIKYPNGRNRPLSGTNLIGTRNDFLPILSLLQEYESAHVSIESGGTAVVSSTPANVIAIGVYDGPSDEKARELSQRTRTSFYISSNNGQVLELKRKHYSENDSNDAETIEIHYSDYRNVNGLMIPFHQETFWSLPQNRDTP